jgi:hypothetical protein
MVKATTGQSEVAETIPQVPIVVGTLAPPAVVRVPSITPLLLPRVRAAAVAAAATTMPLAVVMVLVAGPAAGTAAAAVEEEAVPMAVPLPVAQEV